MISVYLLLDSPAGRLISDGYGAIDATGCYGHRLSRRGGLAVKEGGEEAGGGDVGEEDGGFVAEAHAAVEQA